MDRKTKDAQTERRAVPTRRPEEPRADRRVRERAAGTNRNPGATRPVEVSEDFGHRPGIETAGQDDFIRRDRARSDGESGGPVQLPEGPEAKAKPNLA